MQVTPVLFNPSHPAIREEGDRLKVIPFLKDALWERSGEVHHLSPLYHCQSPPPLFHSHRDAGLQTEEALSFNVALGQLQAVTQARAQLESGVGQESGGPVGQDG